MADTETMQYLPRLTVSCAECKRMKLKCDKKNPCSSCVRRGCSSICPQGRLSSKGSSRYVLASTEQLHDKIDSLVVRVRQLEGALEEIQRRHYPGEPHPLLCKESLTAAGPLTLVEDEAKQTVDNSTQEELSETIGTLTLDDNDTRYSGSTGVFSYFWRVAQGPSDPQKQQKSETLMKALSELPSGLSHFAYSFPFPLIYPGTASMLDKSELGMRILENCLPSHLEAWSLFENYWMHYSWHFTPFPRAEFVNHVLTPIYRRSFHDPQRPLGHRLALLFMVFAIGDLMDFTKPFDSSNALRYYLLARASLCLNPVIESPTLMALQALYLINVFGLMSRGLIEHETMWAITGVNTKLAITLGLHHDPTKLDIPAEEVENRQFALAAIIANETMQALALGRPFSQYLGSVNWIYDPNNQDEPEKSSRYWTASFMRDCTRQVVETMVSTKPITYSRILELDKMIEDFPPYDSIVEAMDVQPLPAFIGMVGEVVRLFLHRRCFALALRDHPEDPLRSVFARSVMTCYRTATILISKMSTTMANSPQIIERIWFTWPNVFVSTLILGSIVARSPGCSLASPAYLELEKASRLWESVAHICGPKILDKLRALKMKASTAFAQYHAAQHDPLSRSSEGIEVTEELHALGGGDKIRVLTSTSTSRQNSSSPLRVEETSGLSDTHSLKSTIPSLTDSPSHSQGTIPDKLQILNCEQSLANFSGPAPGYPDPSSYPYLSLPHNLEDTNFMLEQASGAIPNDFNDIFGSSNYQSMAPSALSGSDILAQLGLMEEWQPMEYMGF